MGMIDYTDRRKTRRRLMAGERVPWVYNSKRAPYILQCILSTPPWQRKEELRALALEAQRLTRETGVQHVLDHEVPLRHPYVCGLTVPWNLRIVPRGVNQAKSNKWHPDQLEISL